MMWLELRWWQQLQEDIRGVRDFLRITVMGLIQLIAIYALACGLVLYTCLVVVHTTPEWEHCTQAYKVADVRAAEDSRRLILLREGFAHFGEKIVATLKPLYIDLQPSARQHGEQRNYQCGSGDQLRVAHALLGFWWIFVMQHVAVYLLCRISVYVVLRAGERRMFARLRAS